jgi:hypothetical protein
LHQPALPPRFTLRRRGRYGVDAYAGTLLHEVAHAVSGTPDVSAGFEDALTAETGTVASVAIAPGH